VPSTDYSKPLPLISSLNQPFWDGLKNRELRLQQCDCGEVRYPPAPLCPRCWSRGYSWAKLSGYGKVNSWVIFHQSYFRGYDDALPYNVAEVELDEGPRLLTNLIEIDNSDIKAGLPVEIVFEDVTSDITLAKFRPRAR